VTAFETPTARCPVCGRVMSVDEMELVPQVSNPVRSLLLCRRRARCRWTALRNIWRTV
jgi:hypothetical protein